MDVVMKTIKVIDEDTLEMKEMVVEGEEYDSEKLEFDKFKQALPCEPEEFGQKYRAFKKASEEFDKVFIPFKENIIKLHEQSDYLPKTVIVDSVKLTYVSPSTRNTIDSKKLKEEEPELAKKFTKTSNVKATVRLEEI